MSDAAGIVWPPLLVGDAARLAALGARLEASEWLPAAAIAARQFDQLHRLARHHARHSPHFARRLAAAGLDADALATPAGLRALPILTRSALQAATDLYAPVPADHLPLRETSTSGATGEPVTVRRTEVSRLDWLAMAMRDHRWHERDFATRFAAIRYNPAGLSERPDWGPPANLLHRTGPALLLGADAYTAAEQHRLLCDFRPRYVLGLSSQVGPLMDVIERSGRAVPELAELRSIGGTLSEATRAQARRLGLALVDGYSAQEVGYIALQCPAGDGYHVMAETVLVELIDEAGQPCPPGAAGPVVITDLRNFATPLIRYALGDAAVAGAPCRCGRGLPVLERILGRLRSLMTAPDGRKFWAKIGMGNQLTLAGVRQYQFVQHDPLHISVLLHADRRPGPAREAALHAELLALLGHPFVLTLHWHDAPLPRSPGGKFEEFVGLGD